MYQTRFLLQQDFEAKLQKLLLTPFPMFGRSFLATEEHSGHTTTAVQLSAFRRGGGPAAHPANRNRPPVTLREQEAGPPLLQEPRRQPQCRGIV